MREHVVVWDGRREGPGGAYIFANEGSTDQAQPEKAYGESTRRLRAISVVLAMDFRTVRQIAEITGLSTDQVNSAVYSLVMGGSIEREHEAKRGRYSGQRYRWVSR